MKQQKKVREKKVYTAAGLNTRIESEFTPQEEKGESAGEALMQGTRLRFRNRYLFPGCSSPFQHTRDDADGIEHRYDLSFRKEGDADKGLVGGGDVEETSIIEAEGCG
ncbi:hypothetical protein L2E82_51318 [Cichorium intybus]|nr:hypothetical protein L2E82_51318 [Cichorium intybus]